MMCNYLVTLTLFFAHGLPEGGHLKVKQYSFVYLIKAQKFAKYYIGRVEPVTDRLSIRDVELISPEKPFKCENFTRGEE